jgi:hypothetical protein
MELAQVALLFELPLQISNETAAAQQLVLIPAGRKFPGHLGAVYRQLEENFSPPCRLGQPLRKACGLAAENIKFQLVDIMTKEGHSKDFIVALGNAVDPPVGGPVAFEDVWTCKGAVTEEFSIRSATPTVPPAVDSKIHTHGPVQPTGAAGTEVEEKQLPGQCAIRIPVKRVNLYPDLSVDLVLFDGPELSPAFAFFRVAAHLQDEVNSTFHENVVDFTHSVCPAVQGRTNVFEPRLRPFVQLHDVPIRR